jgi:hypothetical protein
MRDELESVSYDYAVTLGKSDYPCKEAEFRVHDEYSLVGEYCIETEWAWELLERDITATQYSERVFDNMTYWSKLSERELGEHAREYFNYILE